MPAEFEQRIAFGFEIELCERRLKRQIELLRNVRIDVFKRERLEESTGVGVRARAFRRNA